jgi:hypothetical protein
MMPFLSMRFRKIQKQMEDFVLQSINAEIENCEKKEYKTLLLFLKKAPDPKTGEKLSRTDLVINATLLLYLLSYFDNR